MTDTTDIKVLRDQPDHGPYALVMAQNEALTKGIVVLQRQLEAERQRADRYHFVAMSALEAQAEISERLGISEDECDGSPEQIHEKIEMLQTELAALKAKLANPVVLSDCSFEAVSHMAHWYSEGECVAWVSGAKHVKKKILEAGFTVKGDL